MADKINAQALRERFEKRMRAENKELTSLESKATKLIEKHGAVCAERESLEQQIAEHEAAVQALKAERSSLQSGYMEASFNDDGQRKAEIQERRVKLDKSIHQHDSDIRGLQEQIDGLEDTLRQIAEVRVGLEQLKIDGQKAFAVGTEIRNALVSEGSALSNRRNRTELDLSGAVEDGEDKRRLYTLMESVREMDEEYVERKQAEESKREQDRQDRHRRERAIEEAKQRANTRKVGWSGYVASDTGEKLPRGSVDADGTVKPQYQNKQGTRRAIIKNRPVEVVS